jgi:thiol:disulfide interchange protein DsbD
MRRFRLIFVLSLLLAVGLPARAVSSSADAPHVRVELLIPGDDLYSGDKLNDAGIYFKLEPGWHIYWMNPGDAGEPPRIQWTLPPGITAGPMHFPAPKRLPLGPLMDYGYENEVLFPLHFDVGDAINPKKSGGELGPFTLKAHVSWLVCRGSCIPGKADLEVQAKVWAGLYEIPVLRNRTLGQQFFGELRPELPELPNALPKNASAAFALTPTGFRLTVVTGRRETSASFFPADQNILDNPAPQKFTQIPKGLILDLKKDANLAADPARLKGVLELSGGRAFEITALAGTVAAQTAEGGQNSEKFPSGAKAPDGSAGPMYGLKPVPSTITEPPLSWTLLLKTSGLAFLGGLLLNLMPCVFPVLFLKGLALVNSGNGERHKLRAHGLVYAAGVLVSFWLLVAVLLGLRAAGATLGWGFQFQSPVFLALIAGLLFFLGLSLAGQFEIGLTLTSAGGSLASKHGFTGSFFTDRKSVV